MATSSAQHEVTFRGVLRSEWVKIASLRSTWVTLAFIPVVIAGFGLIGSLTFGRRAAEGGPRGGAGAGAAVTATPDSAFSVALVGSNFALLIIAVLGAVVGSREYSSGMIRLTMTAVPKRLDVLWCKLIVFFAVVTPVVAVSVAGSFVLCMHVIRNRGFDTLTWSDDGVVRTLVGNVGYLVGLGLIGVALGLLLRSLSGSIAAIIGGILFLPTLASALLPQSWSAVLKYLPSQAASAFTELHPSADVLGLGAGTAVFSGWLVLSIAGAAVALKVRDV